MSAEDRTARRSGTERTSRPDSRSSLEEEAKQLGDRLRTAREQQDLSIADVSQSLKLVERTIECLETGDLKTIGMSQTYIEGYYRSYASLLKVDLENTPFSAVRVSTEFVEDESTDLIFMKSNNRLSLGALRSKADVIVFGFVLLLIVVVAIVIWRVWPEAEVVPVTSSTELESPSAEDRGGLDTEEVPFYLREEVEPSETISEQPDLTPDPVDMQSESIETTPDTSAGAETREASQSQPIESGPMGSLTLTFSGLSWVEVKDANAVSLYRDLGTSGDSVSVRGLLPISVRVGDVTTVQVYFNGEEVDTTAVAIGNVANFTLE